MHMWQKGWGCSVEPYTTRFFVHENFWKMYETLKIHTFDFKLDFEFNIWSVDWPYPI